MSEILPELSLMWSPTYNWKIRQFQRVNRSLCLFKSTKIAQKLCSKRLFVPFCCLIRRRIFGKFLIDILYVPNSADGLTLQCVCEKKIQKIITRLPVLTFLVNSSLWEVNFSNWFFFNSDCRFRFLLKKYLHKLSSFLKNSDGSIVKNVKNQEKTG